MKAKEKGKGQKVWRFGISIYIHIYIVYYTIRFLGSGWVNARVETLGDRCGGKDRLVYISLPKSTASTNTLTDHLLSNYIA